LVVQPTKIIILALYDFVNSFSKKFKGFMPHMEKISKQNTSKRRTYS
jgi:hypothetical protein